MYKTLHEAECSRCGRRYSSVSHPKIDGWKQALFEDLGGNDYPYDPDVVHFCPACSALAREFVENEAIPVSNPDDEPLAAWERELLGYSAPVNGEEILDALADILYPLDEYRGSQWNGGDVCEAVATLLAQYRPDARLRQPEWPVYGFTETRALYHLLRPEGDGFTVCGLYPHQTGASTEGLGECLNCARIVAAAVPDDGPLVASDVEPAHKHVWRWSNRLAGFDDAVTRRYCVDCGVLFTDL